LTGLLKVFSDNKIIEDIHGKLRLEAKANANTRMRYAHMQDVVNTSGVLESRKIEHRAAVTNELFLRTFKSTTRTYSHRVHEAKLHKFSKEWSRMMGTKRWGTVSEDTGRLCAAAWEYLQNGCAGLPEEQIRDGMMSSLLSKGLVVDLGGIVMISLGHFKWAGLCWPLTRLGESTYGLGEQSNDGGAC